MKTTIFTLFAIISISFQPFGQISLLKDINQVPSGSMPLSGSIRSFESINNKTVCLTQTNLPEYNLISIDSTNHITTTLLSLGFYYQENMKFTKFNNFLYFFVNTQNLGKELWKTDGTQPGTTKVVDQLYTPSELIIFLGYIYFLNYNTIWKSDGTSAGTSVLINSTNIIVTNPSQNLIGFNNSLIFRTSNKNVYLSKLDLQSLIISNIAQMPVDAGYFPSIITTSIDVDTALYLFDKRSSYYDKTNDNYFLWKIRGSDFQASVIDTFKTYIQDLTRANNHIFFLSKNKLLTISPNANQKSTVLRDTLSTIPEFSYFSTYSTLLNDRFYFIANGKHSSYKLWKSDGTVNGTVAIKDLPFSPIALFTMNNSLYFKLFGQNKLWKSDGTPENTAISVDLPSANIDTLSLFKTQFWVANNKAFFWASTPQYGAEPYFTDGNSVTALVSDIETANNSSNPLSKSLKINGVLYFTAYDDYRGYELWKSDGTPENTVLVKDIAVGYVSSFVDNMTELNGILYFTANDIIHGTQLWRSDGTLQGTYIVKIISGISNYPGSFPANLTVLKGNLYFSAQDGTSNRDLWKSDGTEVGTVKFKQSLSYISVSNIFASNNRLFFVTGGQSFQQVLWTSDGTVNGTHSLKDLNSNTQGLQIYNPTCFTNIENKVYFFAAYNPTSASNYSREALFVSDGTEDGTQVVKDFGYYQTDSLALSSTASLFLTSANRQLFFRVISLKIGSTTSYEYYLWTSNGTTSGTRLLSPDTKSLLGYYKINNTSTDIYYIFNPGYDNQPAELWHTNGNTSTKLKDFPFLYRDYYNFVLFNDSLYTIYNPNFNQPPYTILKIGGLSAETYFSANQSIINLTEMDGNFYFRSYERRTGYELWKLQTCNYVTSKQSGDWNASETWLCNHLPNANDTVLIKPSHTIEVSKAIKRIKTLILRGKLNLQTNTVIEYP